MNKIVGAARFVSALFYALACILLVLFYLQWVKPEKKKDIIRSWARTFINIVGMRFDVQGEVYDRYCLIVANHISFIDIFSIYSRVLSLCVYTPDNSP